MTGNELRNLLLAAAGLGLAALLPLVGEGFLYRNSLDIAMFTVLATSWALFSGPTHYISLATGAFFGLGSYVVALGFESLPFPMLALIAVVAGGVTAGLVGLATLRLSGVYFVIFTLGLAELVRQLVTWVQNNFTSDRGFTLLMDSDEDVIYWQLLALAGAVYLLGWLINRSRLGFALRIIGNDETVARHSGIHTARAKVLLFMVPGMVAALVGALMVPRYQYIDPGLVFSPLLSFQVVIMALLGGTHRLWGPLIGVIPFVLVWDQIGSQFPNQTSLLIGVIFLLVVYVIPNGLAGRLEQLMRRYREGRG